MPAESLRREQCCKERSTAAGPIACSSGSEQKEEPVSEATTRSSAMSRPWFLLASGVMAAGSCISGINLREALAESQRTGKPLLTDAAFAGRLLSLRSSQSFRQEIEDMKRSLPVYSEILKKAGLSITLPRPCAMPLLTE
jgi:hypothetical protein